MTKWFAHWADRVSIGTGTWQAFAGALFVILAWLLTGPVFQYSDTWQLVINTGTTIVTFLMVFLVQNSQNRQAREHADTQQQLREMLTLVSKLVQDESTELSDVHRLVEDEYRALGQFVKIEP